MGEYESGSVKIAPQGLKEVSLEVTEEKNGDVARVTWPFKFHSPSHRDLVKLRERERLEEIVKPGKTQLEKVLLVKRWAAKNTPGRGGARYPTWKAWEILDNIRNNDNIIVMCGQSGMAFLQACCSLGIQCRYVELGRKDNPYCHWNTEVFLTDYDKWAIVDATPIGLCNVHLTRQGIPQNALELHRAYLSGEYDDFVAVHDDEVVDPSKHVPAQEIIPMFYYFRVIFTQDHQTENPPYFDIENTWDRWNDAIEWQDDLTVPWTENPSSQTWCLPHRRFTLRSTSREEDLYWHPSDECRIEMTWFKDTTFRVKLNNLCPDFQNHLVNLDGAGWKKSLEWFAWDVPPGTHSIEARTVTRAENEGPITRLRFNVKKL